jgi:CheY-like chemotaxis protein
MILFWSIDVTTWNIFAPCAAVVGAAWCRASTWLRWLMHNEAAHDMQEGSSVSSEEDVSRRVVDYLIGKGIAERKQAGLVAEITGLSIIHARRKLSGTHSWSMDEGMSIAAHFGETLGAIVGHAPEPVGIHEACEVQIGSIWYAGSVCVDAEAVHARPSDLVALRVGPPAHGISSLKIFCAARANVRVAILDDDVIVASSVRDALAGHGFSAQAFFEGDQVHSAIDAFDVFIVDFFLKGEQTATSLIRAIREAKPDTLILVLTGRAREGFDDEIAQQIRLYNVQVHEKPAQMRYLVSAIEGWLDRRW